MPRRETQVKTGQRRSQMPAPGGVAGGSGPCTGKAGNTRVPQRLSVQTGSHPGMRTALLKGGDVSVLSGEVLKCIIVYTHGACLLIFLPDRLHDRGLIELSRTL